ncbi:4'-phosphopantetheinyl transferase superfamily protein [Rhodanobacter sp. AS-Z3]|uniref:4'-phosphopantetheinyl transferase family protein n=1 Tax=Rhodanobacter sp. AS-Z3 TaxID=3031330 RepID=UPI0024789F3F|nr:4'-phosphopantetheinyl transferase superfamily protein [Rhodanobacter sp. AS-Z3]WEN16925.1 4'-phosphopantetheinyl transferase superfamily protein [Rhodanobacter sp. AS-Z3]
MPARSTNTHLVGCSITRSNDFPIARNSLPEHLSVATKERQREFLAGRQCARNALGLAGCTMPGDLAIGTDGLPQWPDGWLGSISHNRDAAVAVAASKNLCNILGVDLEAWIDDDVAEEIHEQVFQPSELAQFPGYTPAQALTLVFSAKETLYKALYPEMRQFRDFKAACVIGVSSDHIYLRLEIDWGGAWRRGVTLAVTYAHSNIAVCTLLDKA